MQLTLDTLKETGAFTGRPVKKKLSGKAVTGKSISQPSMCARWATTPLKLNCWRITGNRTRLLSALRRIFAIRTAPQCLPRLTFLELLPQIVARSMGRSLLLCWPSSRSQRSGKDYELTGEDEFWCELVMNGIGGRTIAEAQERMSLREFQVWVKYRNKYGQLNVMMRTEWGLRWWLLSG